MATLKQIAANRANAQKSTGPKTEAGKQASSKNATTHSALANTVCLSSESKAIFDQIHASFTAEYLPATPTEIALVETMAVARMHLLRIWAINTASFEIEIHRQPAGAEVGRAALAFRSLADNSNSLRLLLRYETAYDRQFTRALNTLLKLRAAAEPAPQEPTVAPQPEPAQPEKVILRNKPDSPPTPSNEAPLHRKPPAFASPALSGAHNAAVLKGQPLQ
jgi:hypothetical protein